MGVAGLAVCGLLAGCGGTRQDAHEPDETFHMEVTHASFPSQQAVASPVTFTIRVHNSGSKTIPNVAITVDSFNYHSNFPELAASSRPVWAVEHGPGTSPHPPVQSVEVSTPGSGQTAYVNTWALGPLAAGETHAFSWLVVPVEPGRHVVHYSVAAGLAGKSRARASNGKLHGTFLVDVAGAPPHTVVNPNTGRVEPGTEPAAP
jgi:hypothetical protein